MSLDPSPGQTINMSLGYQRTADSNTIRDSRNDNLLLSALRSQGKLR